MDCIYLEGGAEANAAGHLDGALSYLVNLRLR